MSARTCRDCGAQLPTGRRGRPRLCCVTCAPPKPPRVQAHRGPSPPASQRDQVRCPLTPRELELIGLLADGLTYKQIALRLNRSPSTIRNHLRNACGRLDVRDRVQAILKCARQGWIVSDPAIRTREQQLLEEIKPILAACLHQLEQGTRHRVTRSQYAYLQAFDRYLRGAEVRTGSMLTALKAVLDDAHVVPSSRSRASAPLDLQEAA